MTLSDFVKEYRKEHDLSQRLFAAICGLSNGYISMLERNLNPKTGLPLTPSLPALKKISTVMGCLWEIFSRPWTICPSICCRIFPRTAQMNCPPSRKRADLWTIWILRLRRLFSNFLPRRKRRLFTIFSTSPTGKKADCLSLSVLGQFFHNPKYCGCFFARRHLINSNRIFLPAVYARIVTDLRTLLLKKK